MSNRDDHGKCWNSTLNKLVAYLASLGVLFEGMSAVGTERTSSDVRVMSAFGGKADMGQSARDVCL